MRIKELFVKDIYRNINGVIKVEQDDSENVFQELDEYVVTKEMDRHFHDFFNSYNKSLDYNTDKIGVWVSGFFGSGKSHFIKILSYLLSNKRIDGKRALDFFKGKFQDDMFLSDINRAVTEGSADVILFNIDSKSDAPDKSEKARIVEVFMKVFNEMQGYCGEIPWLGELERELDKRGQYEDFKKKYAEITGQEWKDNRGTFYFDRDNIVKALSLVTDMSEESAEKWFDSGEQNYTLSIEKFAKIVLDYCEFRGNHRVLFLVDEMGQYIGDNTELMLNLQTLTEDLGRFLNGKAWVVVTSQEAIDFITKLKGRDFSKIKGRFSTQLNLSSDNTDAVIKKRILEKKEHTKDYLTQFYVEKAAILRNIINFSANTAEMKSYKSEEEFAEVYPFIPYQFNLVQKVFEQIRRTGATGAHLSEGERSMLSAFQESGKLVGGEETGRLVPFSYFYQSIETFLHSGIKRTINQAYENSRLTEDDCKILKILFMIKYIKEIRPNVENLTTLSITHIDEDKSVLRNGIRESLERLKAETLINQHGDEYEFLTDEEQDVEREIKSIDIEGQNIIEYAGNIIFDDLYKDKKYKYSNYNQYPFNSQIDDYYKGSQGHELTVKIMTPWNDNYTSPFRTIMGSADSLIFKLPDDAAFLEEIKKMLQIRQFMRRKSSLKNSEMMQKILDSKNIEIHKIQDRVKFLLEDALKKSEIYLCGDRVNIKGNSAKDIINNSLSKMVENIYSKVDYIKIHTPCIEDIQKLLNANDLELFSQEGREGNKLAEEEVKTFIERQHDRSLKTTVKTVKDRYSKKPYGWDECDIAGFIASLYVKGLLKIKYNLEYVTNKKNIPDYLMKKDYSEKVLIEPKPVIPPEIIVRVKKTMMEAFGSANLPDEPEGLFSKTGEILKGFHEELKGYIFRYSGSGGELYPGKKILEDGLEVLSDIIGIKNELQYFNAIIKHKEDLLDFAEDIEPVRSFFKNQVSIFDKNFSDYKRYQNDKYYLDDEAKRNLDKMKETFHMKEPYSKIKELPLLAGAIKESHEKTLEDYKKRINEKIDGVTESLEGEFEKYKDILKPEFKESVLSYYGRLLRDIEGLRDCTKLEALMSQIDKHKKTSLQQIEEEVKKHKPDRPPKKIRYIKDNDLSHWNSSIESEVDLDKYMGNLRDKMKKILEKDEIIKFI